VILHNVIVKYKLSDVEGNLQKYLQEHKKADSWKGWNEYAQKNLSRLRIIQKVDRLEPVTEGKDEIVLNPELYFSKTQNKVSTLKCSLGPNKDGVPFATQFETAYKDYSASNLTKMTVETLLNFHRLVLMEIQYLASVDGQWKNNSGSGSGGSAEGSGGGAGAPSQDANILTLLQIRGERTVLAHAVQLSQTQGEGAAAAATSTTADAPADAASAAASAAAAATTTTADAPADAASAAAARDDTAAARRAHSTAGAAATTDAQDDSDVIFPTS
jgi:hypothetical protein